MSCRGNIEKIIAQSGRAVKKATLDSWESLLKSKAETLSKAEFYAEVQSLIDRDISTSRAVRAAKFLDIQNYNAAEQGWLDSSAKSGGKLKAKEYVRNLIQGGAISSMEGGNLSLRSFIHGKSAEYLDMYSQLDKFKDQLESGSIDRAIIQETDLLQKGLPSGGSGNKVAAEAAKVFHAIKKKMFSDKKAVSPTLQYNKDYFFEQTHSLEKIAAAGKSVWVSDAMRLFGDKSFTDLDPEAKLAKFGEIYDNMNNRVYGTTSGGDTRFKLSQSRDLIPKDWQAFADYHSKYGEGTITQVMINSILSSARDIGRIEKFGSNADAWLDAVHKRIGKHLTPEERVDLNKARLQHRGMIERVTGKLNTPAEGVFAVIEGMQKWVSMALSGRTVISSMPDLPVAIGLLKDSIGNNSATIASEIMTKFSKAITDPVEAKKAMLKLGIYFESYKHALARELGSGSDLNTGKGLAKKAYGLLSDNYGKIAMIDRYQLASRYAIATYLGHNLADLAEKPWDQLSKQAQEGLLRYRFQREEWPLIRLASVELPVFGSSRKIVAASAALEIPDEAVSHYMRITDKWKSDKEIPLSLLNKERQSIQLKIAAMVNDHVDIGTSTTQARQQYFMWGNTETNSAEGQIRKMIGMFKGASLASMDAVRRRAASQGSTGGRIAAVASTASGMYFMAMLAQWASDAFQGKTPESPTTSEFHLKALARSGAAGVFGDLLARQIQADGIDNIQLKTYASLAGPLPGKAIEGVAIAGTALKEALSGDYYKKYPTGRAASWATGLIPYQNVFWLQGVINGTFLNTFRESLNEGMPGQVAKRLRETPSFTTESGHQEYFVPFFDPTEGR